MKRWRQDVLRVPPMPFEIHNLNNGHTHTHCNVHRYRGACALAHMGGFGRVCVPKLNVPWMCVNQLQFPKKCVPTSVQSCGNGSSYV